MFLSFVLPQKPKSLIGKITTKNKKEQFIELAQQGYTYLQRFLQQCSVTILLIFKFLVLVTHKRIKQKKAMTFYNVPILPDFLLKDYTKYLTIQLRQIAIFPGSQTWNLPLFPYNTI